MLKECSSSYPDEMVTRISLADIVPAKRADERHRKRHPIDWKNGKLLSTPFEVLGRRLYPLDEVDAIHRIVAQYLVPSLPHIVSFTDFSCHLYIQLKSACVPQTRRGQKTRTNPSPTHTDSVQYRLRYRVTLPRDIASTNLHFEPHLSKIDPPHFKEGSHSVRHR
ncbi:hypothetical protein BDZ45DRAFT_244622 [Acephala macrosclerotiorum]|nr:hypothetical protein BDZ45DRAFT_244622 [Acephala macrosclerotiorum]